MAVLQTSFAKQNTPLEEYNLANERSVVSKYGMSTGLELGDWGISDHEGSANYDFTHSDGPMLFISCMRAARENIYDQPDYPTWSDIQRNAILDMMEETQEAGFGWHEVTHLDIIDDVALRQSQA